MLKMVYHSPSMHAKLASNLHVPTWLWLKIGFFSISFHLINNMNNIIKIQTENLTVIILLIIIIIYSYYWGKNLFFLVQVKNSTAIPESSSPSSNFDNQSRRLDDRNTPTIEQNISFTSTGYGGKRSTKNEIKIIWKVIIALLVVSAILIVLYIGLGAYRSWILRALSLVA